MARCAGAKLKRCDEEGIDRGRRRQEIELVMNDMSKSQRSGCDQGGNGMNAKNTKSEAHAEFR